jgi:hypothetical protein
MIDAKKADKISTEELHFLETLKKEFNMLNLKVENTKLQYENALFKIMRKYGLSESDSIDESTGVIVRRPTAAPPVAAPPPSPPLPPLQSAPVLEAAVEEPSKEEVKSKKGKRDFK